MALNIGAMLIAFLALIALLDGILHGIHNGFAHYGFAWFPSSLESILGVAVRAGRVGDRGSLARLPVDRQPAGHAHGAERTGRVFAAWSAKAALDPRSFTIATFALCGFANLSSIGIQIGGIGALAPNRKGELARLGFRAMLAGTMANLMSASIAGMLL